MVKNKKARPDPRWSEYRRHEASHANKKVRTRRSPWERVRTPRGIRGAEPGFYFGIGMGLRPFEFSVHPRGSEYRRHEVSHANKQVAARKLGSVDITCTVRGKMPRVSFEQIAKRILGTGYDLSIVLSGDALSRKLNWRYRRKNYPPNVLSFPLGKNEGEIFLNIRRAEREARSLGVSLRERAALLFIHGCLHLAGHRHGREMEKFEKHLLKYFGRVT